jgi:hypothetical protein
VSSGLDLRVNRSLELLGSLKQTAAKFAKREEQLSRELTSRRYAANRASQEAIGNTESTYATKIAQTEEAFRAEAERVKAVYEGRRARVQRASAAALRNLPARGQEVKGRWLGDLQMRNYNAQRRLPLDIAAADADYAGFTTKLDAHATTLLGLLSRARSSFRGYFTLGSMLRRRRRTEFDADAPLSQHLEQIQGHLATAEEQLGEFDRFALPRFFSYAPLPVFFLLIFGAAAALAWYFGGFNATHAAGTSAVNPPLIIAGIAAVVLFGFVWFVHFLGLSSSKATAKIIAEALGEARRIIDACRAAGPAMAASREAIRQQIEAAHERTCAEIQEQWTRADQVAAEFIATATQKLETQTPRILEKIDRILPPKLQQIESNRAAWYAHLQGEAAALKQKQVETHAAETATLSADEKVRWDEIEADWKREIVPIYQSIDALNAEASSKFPAWSAALVENWTAPTEFTPATRFGHLDLDLSKLPAALPKDPRLALPGPANVSVPLALNFPSQGSLLFETSDSGDPKVIGSLNNVILRLLATTPPGKLSFTIIDPISLGQNFSGLMHLGDYEESLINRRIWTQRDQIEERLAEQGEHIEKVIQMYLRNEYETITEYNEKAGSVAEKYHFLVVADFPAAFSDVAAKRLQSIAQSGPRCGIFTLIHWDSRQPLPAEFVPEDRRRVCAQQATNRAGRGAGLRFSPRSRTGRQPREQDRPEQHRLQSRTGSLCPNRAQAGRDVDARNHQRTAHPHRAHRRDETPVSRHRKRDPPARALRRQNGFGQIDALPRHYHQSRPDLQSRPGAVLPHRLQERCRVQMLCHQASPACKSGCDRERPRIRLECPAARGRGVETPWRPVPQNGGAGCSRIQAGGWDGTDATHAASH